ncbi:t-SNARE [Xylographa pallens]|nr:t-SNARE [Xylographa pallens]
MSSANYDDPFLQVQADVLSTLDITRPLFTSYLRIRSLASTPLSPELSQARSELETNLQDLSTDLQDLVESVRAAEKDPFRYGLDVAEVGRRRRLVEEVGGEIEDMREELVKAVASTHVQGGGMGLPSPSAFDAESPREDDYGAFEQQRQVEIMHEQDEALDGVFKTVGNLREQAHVMGRELEEQGEMLDEVDTLTDRLGGKLQGGMKKITTIIRKNEDTMSSCCIGVLIFVLILLLILAIAL